mmetsp:Transcript_28358/g.41726  ORF Transcript_28358/g.41726 Transcript_28358/m.41726 type:complete len:124 (-) Transcript_28358:93-464(-)
MRYPPSIDEMKKEMTPYTATRGGVMTKLNTHQPKKKKENTIVTIANMRNLRSNSCRSSFNVSFSSKSAIPVLIVIAASGSNDCAGAFVSLVFRFRSAFFTGDNSTSISVFPSSPPSLVIVTCC